jgi:N-acetyl-gamma-glutamyl-phosphate reductase
MASVFIDGEAGTTGLGIRARLAAQPVDVVRIDPAARKNTQARQAIMAAVDVVILCLPDEAARQAVSLADALGPRAPRIIDASTAFRTDAAWAYGFPELNIGQADRIAYARKVSNPGCYATGAIALLRPLVDAGIVPADHPIAINAVSGYSGAGRAAIEAHEASGGPAFELYGLGLDHKHIPEITLYSALARPPIFLPAVGHFRQGMIVSIPLDLADLPGRVSAADLRHALAKRYADAAHVRVIAGDAPARLDPQALNDTDHMELMVGANPSVGQAVLLARLDNLGKGASGAAIQNLRLMLGLAEEHGSNG